MFESLQGEKRIMPRAACAMRAQLTENEKKVYDAICRAISRKENSVTLTGLQAVDFPRVANAIRRDQPFFYYLKQAGGMKCSSSVLQTAISWEFQLSSAEIDRYDWQIERKLRTLKLPKGGTVLQREIYLHDMMQKIDLRAGSDDWTDHTIIGPLLLGHTVCQGMAMLFYLLCTMCRVPCRYISGRGRSNGTEENHGWNLVRIDGEYVHVDVFWDALLHVKSFNGYCYDYFNLSDRYMRQDHSWNSSDYPACVSDKHSYIVFQQADVHSFRGYRELVRRCRNKGKYTITARMHYDYRIDECTSEVLNAYREAGGAGLSYRTNDGQKILEIRVKKRNEVNG